MTGVSHLEDVAVWRGEVLFRPVGADRVEITTRESDDPIVVEGRAAHALRFMMREAAKPRGPGVEYEVAALTCRCGAFDRAVREAKP